MRADYEQQLDARYAAARGFVDAIVYPEDTRDGARAGAAQRAAESRAAPRRVRASRPHGGGNTNERRKKVVRVAGAQGFWGDWLEAPRRQVEGGPVDYLMLDYLAEVTMSILQKQKERDPNDGVRARLRRRDGSRCSAAWPSAASRSSPTRAA